MSKLLVTTSLEETWGEDETLVFLGEWCKRYRRKSVWEKRRHTVVTYHWRDRSKIKRDYDYLEQFYERLLSALADTLNKHHGVKQSLRYWRIILGPWLLTYVAVVWDRWENLRLAFNEHEFDETVVLDCDAVKLVPSDYTSALELFSDDLWNNRLFSEILKAQFNNKVSLKIMSYDVCGFTQENIDPPKRTIKWKFAYWIDRFLGFIQRNYKVVFVQSFFHPKVLIKIALKLRQFPRFHFEFDEKVKMPAPSSNRRELRIDFNPQSPFEEFVRDNIAFHIPLAYFEGYPAIKQATSRLPNGEIIFTANSHYYNELFKVWCAEKVAKQKKLIISEHGGAFRSAMSIFDHEEKISDKKTVWHKPMHDNHEKLSPNKMIGFTPNRIEAKDITIIGLEFPLYSYRCQSGPCTGLILDDYQQKLAFANKLAPEVMEHLKIRPFLEQGWSTRQRYIDDLGDDKISPYNSTREAIAHSKLVVCTYPQTTLSETMHSDVPMILLYPEHLWELAPEFESLVQKMKEAKIIFSDPDEAAHHINKIWNDPESWWNSDKTFKAREHFFDQCGRVRKDWLYEWSSFFEKELKGV